MDRDRIFEELQNYVAQQRKAFKDDHGFDPDDMGKATDLGRVKALMAYHARVYNYLGGLSRKMEA